MAKLYGIGVGPGDPELLTLKAVRLIRACGAAAFPGTEPRTSAAFRIAEGAVPELREKELLPLALPMTMDEEELRNAHRRAAEIILSRLRAGTDVVFLTLGDVTVYSTFFYIRDIVAEEGFEVELVSGVPSFCAAAAALDLPLGIGDEEIHILPGIYGQGEELPERGTLVVMKSGSRLKDIRKQLLESGRETALVERCGMEGERIFRSPEEIPDETSYFSLLIAREKRYNDA